MTTPTSIPEAVVQGYLTPAVIANYYDIPHHDGSGVKVGIISLGGGFSQTDLDKSMDEMGLPRNTINFISVPSGQSNPGLTNPDSGEIENTLDIYCVAGMVPKATINFYRGNNSTYFADAINQAVTDKCDVISISWGYWEILFGNILGVSINSMETAFQNAASNNIPVLVASGDNGFNPVNNNRGNYKGVQYPASSTKVISVGGTVLLPNYPEYAATSSAGGVSIIKPVPPWQAGLTTISYPSGSVSTLTGRGVPDLSGPFYLYAMYYNLSLYNIPSSYPFPGTGGTSAAAPIMAGMFARLKGLLNKSLSSDSYNNLFYNNISAFYNNTFNQTIDVNEAIVPKTVDFSDNDDTNIEYLVYNGYYASANGWDPITGLGRPKGRAIYRLLGLTGNTYPVNANKNRPISGVTYPRTQNKIRQ
jgi:kumamolisin